MAEFKIKLAGVCIKVNSVYDYVMNFCRDYFCNEEPAFEITTDKNDIEKERLKSIEEEKRDNLPHVEHKDDYLEILAVYRKIVAEMLDYDTLLMHGAVVELDGKAYMFTAKSGTGKTTHIKLWKKKFGKRLNVVNGDKPLIKITEGQSVACGTPWRGKECFGENVQVPLKAICVLERDKTNHIRQVKMSEILTIMLQQSYRGENASQALNSLRLLDMMSKNVKFYVLGCNMQDEAADVSYNGMQN